MLLVATLCSGGAAAETSDFASNWLDLWTRCRLTVESPDNLDTSGLRGGTSVEYGTFERARSWHHSDDRMVLIEGEWPRRDGLVRYGCKVVAAPDSAPPTPAEIDAVADILTLEMERLVAEERHVDRNPNPLFEVTHGIGPVAPNAHDCTVILCPFVGKADRLLLTGSGEQANEPCRSPSRLNEDGSTLD